MADNLAIDSLQKMGEEKVLEVLALKSSSSELFDNLFGLFYVKRMPLHIKEICDFLNVEYQTAYNIIIKLMHLGLLSTLEDSKNDIMLSQEGIDFYINYSKLELDESSVVAISKKHSVETLKLLKNQEGSWTSLRDRLKISESSMKNVFDNLTKYAMIYKDSTNYSITDRGLKVLTALECLSNFEFAPKYEVQIKVLATKKLDEIVEMIALLSGKIKEEHVKQIDHYFKSTSETGRGTSYLRLRSETPIGKQSLKSMPEHTITWGNVKERIKYQDIWIISRQKEEIIVPYPAILFFLDFFGAKLQKKIMKIRTTIYVLESQVTIHFDKIETPNRGQFIELKTSAWNREEARRKAKIIQELMAELTLGDVKSIEQTYYEFI